MHGGEGLLELIEAAHGAVGLRGTVLLDPGVEHSDRSALGDQLTHGRLGAHLHGEATEEMEVVDVNGPAVGLGDGDVDPVEPVVLGDDVHRRGEHVGEVRGDGSDLDDAPAPQSRRGDIGGLSRPAEGHPTAPRDAAEEIVKLLWLAGVLIPEGHVVVAVEGQGDMGDESGVHVVAC